MKKFVCLFLLLTLLLFSCFGDIVLTADTAAQMARENNRGLKLQEISFMDKERTAKNRWNVFLPEITATAGVSRGNEILKNLKSLGRFPEQGPSVEALTGFKTDLRILLCDKHIALYRIENGTVLISRIVDARQDYLRILFGEDYLD